MAPQGMSFINLARNTTGATVMGLGIQVMEFTVPHICGVLNPPNLLLQFYTGVGKGSLTIVSTQNPVYSYIVH